MRRRVMLVDLQHLPQAIFSLAQFRPLHGEIGSLHPLDDLLVLLPFHDRKQIERKIPRAGVTQVTVLGQGLA